MPSLNEKLAFNNQVQLSLAQEIEFYKASFDALAEQQGFDLTSDQQAYMRDYISGLETTANNKLLTIEREDWGQNITINRSEGYRTVAYGYCRLGGVRSFFTADQGDSGEFAHQYITLTSHSVQGIEKLFLDTKEVEFATTRDGNGRLIFGWSIGATWGLPLIGKVFLSALTRGTAGQDANSDLVAQSVALFPGLWTADHRQDGYAGAYTIFYYDSEVFINGMPEIGFEGYWKNDIYDPRTETFGWTDNSALIWADYMTMAESEGGPGFTYDEIDIDHLIEQADICDELVSLSAGGTEKRYRTNGSFNLSSSYSHDKVKQDLELACGAESFFSGGKWKLYVGAWRAPVKSLNVNHFRSSLSIQLKPSIDQTFNRVKGLYLSEDSLWELSEYPPITNSTYATEDGGEKWGELDLVYVTSGPQAQRIAKIYLEKSRQWIIVSGDFNAETAVLTPGDNITLTYDKFGWDEKPFRVMSLDGKISGPKLETSLLLYETAEAIYDWTEEETTIDLAPNTSLPNPAYVRIPAGLTLESGTNQLDIRSDGTIFSRIKASWTASVDVFVLAGGFHEIQFKRSSDSDWRGGGMVSGRDTYAYILDLKDGEAYDVRVRAKTQFGESTWLTVSNHLVLGKSALPSTPATFTNEVSDNGISLKWSQITDRDLGAYEIRLGTTFATGTSIIITKSDSYTYKTLASGDYKFWLASIDTSGNYSNPRSLDITISSPGQTGTVEALAIFQIVKLTWTEAPRGTFPISEYKILKGATFGGASEIGKISANVFPVQEQAGGTFTYWVVPVDIYGNEGTPSYVTVAVKAFTFFQLITDTILSGADATLTSAVYESGEIILPVDTTETWNQHFTTRSWTDFDDQGTAGFPIWYEPSETSGTAVFEYDYGSVIDTAQVAFVIDGEWVDGSGTVVIKVATSDDAVTWDEETATSKIGTNFQYARLTVEVTPTDTASLYSFDNPRILLEVVTEDDYGTVSALSSDVSGTTVTYNKDFLDVFEDSVILQYKGSNSYLTGYTFSGNTASVYLWDTSGARVSGSVSWRVTGIVAR
jgi:hypothetical protein